MTTSASEDKTAASRLIVASFRAVCFSATHMGLVHAAIKKLALAEAKEIIEAENKKEKPTDGQDD